MTRLVESPNVIGNWLWKVAINQSRNGSNPVKENSSRASIYYGRCKVNKLYKYIVKNKN
jgi:hypothetical protein